MNVDSHNSVTRRRVLGLLGAGVAAGVAGCIGGGTNANGGAPDEEPGTESGTADSPRETDTPDESGLDDGAADGDSGGTNLAGSCGAAFGDTDTRYDPGGNCVVTFAYPMGGEVVNETLNTVTAGYPAGAGGQYDQSITVNQRGPSDGTPDVGATRLANEPQFEDGGTVTYRGSERTVAVVRSDNSVVWVIGIAGPDGVYELQVQGSVRMGDPCPDAYEAVCEGVVTSFSRDSLPQPDFTDRL